jgi:hypothetical protein
MRGRIVGSLMGERIMDALPALAQLATVVLAIIAVLTFARVVIKDRNE